MFKAGFTLAVLMTAGSLAEATNQPAVAQVEKIAPIAPDLSLAPHTASAQVYLLRGLLNVFSLGMDRLTFELRRAGISAIVANHTQWPGIADEIAANYKAGQRGPIVLIGHSLGADAVMSMGEYLGQKGIPVSLIVPFDGISSHAASANVARILNFYKSESVKITRGPGFRGELTNYYVSDPNVTHFNIDKNSTLHSLVINKIRGIPNSRSAALAHARSFE